MHRRSPARRRAAAGTPLPPLEIVRTGAVGAPRAASADQSLLLAGFFIAQHPDLAHVTRRIAAILDQRAFLERRRQDDAVRFITDLRSRRERVLAAVELDRIVVHLARARALRVLRNGAQLSMREIRARDEKQ